MPTGSLRPRHRRTSRRTAALKDRNVRRRATRAVGKSNGARVSSTRVLYVSGSIGLGHVNRDLAVAGELRSMKPARSGRAR